MFSGGKVTILVNWDDETSSNNTILDASALDGHAMVQNWISLVSVANNGGVNDDDKNGVYRI